MTRQPLTLAVIGAEGNIVEQGEAVSREAWHAALETYFDHLRDLGILRDHDGSPG